MSQYSPLRSVVVSSKLKICENIPVVIFCSSWQLVLASRLRISWSVCEQEYSQSCVVLNFGWGRPESIFEAPECCLAIIIIITRITIIFFSCVVAVVIIISLVLHGSLYDEINMYNNNNNNNKTLISWRRNMESDSRAPDVLIISVMNN